MSLQQVNLYGPPLKETEMCWVEKTYFFGTKLLIKSFWDFFFEKRALSLLSLYHCLTSCKKLERLLEPFLRVQNEVNLLDFGNWKLELDCFIF